MLMYCRRFSHHAVSHRRIQKAADIEKIQLNSTASVAVDNIKTVPPPQKKVGAKHPEFCQKQEVRSISSQPVCRQQACYLNAGESPVSFDDCLSSYSSTSITSLSSSFHRHFYFPSSPQSIIHYLRSNFQ